MSIFCTAFWCLQKYLFQKIIVFSFWPLDHNLCLFGTCRNYCLCSLDPGESTGNNYSITWVTKKILTQEKHIFQFCLKVKWMKLKFKSKFLRFLTDLATSKRPGEVKNGSKMFGKRALESWGIGLSNALWIRVVRRVEKKWRNFYCPQR